MFNNFILMKIQEHLEAKTWFLEVIKEYRDQYKKCSDNVKKFLWKIEDFQFPCQILSLTISSPRQSYIFVTKDKKRDDLDVRSYGPFMPYQIKDAMIEILSDQNLYQPSSLKDMNEWDEISFGEFLENDFLDILERIKYQTTQPPIEENKPIVGMKKASILNGFEWFVYGGDLWKLTPQSFVTKIFDGAVSREQEKRAEQVSNNISLHSEKEAVISGFATYFYPHIWVGDVPIFNFQSRVEGLFIFPTPTFSRIYKNRVVVIGQRGFFFIEEKDKTNCITLMNEIIGTSILLGYEFDIVREEDVGEATVSTENHELRGLKYPNSLSRNWQVRKDLFGHVEENVLTSSIKIVPEKILEIVGKSEELTSNSDVSRSIVLMARASAHLKNSEFLESAILSWLIIEIYFHKLWDDFLLDSNITEKRKKKLSFIKMDTIIEQLSLSKKISLEIYNKIMSLKKIRNEINHEGYITSLEESSSFYQFAYDLIKERSLFKNS